MKIINWKYISSGVIVISDNNKKVCHQIINACHQNKSSYEELRSSLKERCGVNGKKVLFNKLHPQAEFY